MAHFDFSLTDFTSGKNISSAVIGGTKNYTPRGEAKPLKTTFSISPLDEAKPLTTANISDVLQGTTVYKPMGLVYNSFNDALSRDIQLARNLKVGNKLLSIDGAHTGLLPYDANKKDATIDISSGVNSLYVSTSPTNTTPASDQTTQSAGGQDSGPGTEIFVPPAGKSWPKGRLTIDDVAKLVIEVGIREETQPTMVAIANRESGGFNSGSYNPVGLDNSWGLWQINVIEGASPQYKKYDLTDPYTNAKIMAEMSRGGEYLHPWYTQWDGTNEEGYSAQYSVVDFMPEAIAAIQRVKAQGYRASS